MLLLCSRTQLKGTVQCKARQAERSKVQQGKCKGGRAVQQCKQCKVRQEQSSDGLSTELFKGGPPSAKVHCVHWTAILVGTAESLNMESRRTQGLDEQRNKYSKVQYIVLKGHRVTYTPSFGLSGGSMHSEGLLRL